MSERIESLGSPEIRAIANRIEELEPMVKELADRLNRLEEEVKNLKEELAKLAALVHALLLRSESRRPLPQGWEYRYRFYAKAV